MSAHAEALGRAHDEHHGPPTANRSSRVDPTILGMLLFIASEAMLFGSFFAALLLRPRRQPERADDLAAAAVRVPGLRRERQHRDPRHLELHGALGDAVDQAQRPQRPEGRARRSRSCSALAFLLTQVVEYAHIGFNTSDGAFASTFFGLTGLHGAHVFVGLTLLTIAAGARVPRALLARAPPRRSRSPAIYWHFVDVMWIVVCVDRLPPLTTRGRRTLGRCRICDNLARDGEVRPA